MPVLALLPSASGALTCWQRRSSAAAVKGLGAQAGEAAQGRASEAAGAAGAGAGQPLPRPPSGRAQRQQGLAVAGCSSRQGRHPVRSDTS